MSGDIQQRIAAIIDRFMDECCQGHIIDGVDLAAVLASELGLTRERGISLAGDPITATIYPDIYGPKWSRHARYVTTWEAEK